MNGQVHHIELYVSDLERSRLFWAWLLERLGYTLYQTWPLGFSYSFDKTYIVFVQTETNYLKEAYHRKHVGLNHLAFHADLQLLNQLHHEAIDLKIPLLYEERYPYAAHPDHQAFFMEDPDRIKVEIASY